MAKLTKEQNDALYARISALRVSRPESYARVRIELQWDRLNKYYEDNGIDDEFCRLRKQLRDTIKQFSPIIPLTAIVGANERVLIDRKRGLWKTKHGYNFNYAPVSH